MNELSLTESILAAVPLASVLRAWHGVSDPTALFVTSSALKVLGTYPRRTKKHSHEASGGFTCVEMADSPPNVVLLPQYKSVSGTWFPIQGYGCQFKVTLWLSSGQWDRNRITECHPQACPQHSLQDPRVSSSYWSPEPSVEDGRASLSPGLWVTAWSTVLVPSSSSPITLSMGFYMSGK